MNNPWEEIPLADYESHIPDVTLLPLLAEAVKEEAPVEIE